MRAAAVILVVVAVAGCGRSTESGDPSGVPDLSIMALRSNGLIASAPPATTAAPTTAAPTTAAPPAPTTSTTTGTTTVPAPLEIVVPLTPSEASVDTDVSDGRAGVLDGAVGAFGVETATIGIAETDVSEMTLTWTVEPGVFAAAGPNPQVQVLLDTMISAELTTGDWAGMQPLMYVEAVGTYGGVEFGRSEQVIAQIDRDGDAALRGEPFGFGFGSPVDGEPSPIRIAHTARCSVAGSTDAFGVLSEAACDAYEAGQILLANARLTVSGSAG